MRTAESLWQVTRNGFRVAVVGLLATLGIGACGDDASTYLVEFVVSDAPSDLGQLSFRVNHDAGDFVGNGSEMSCSLNPRLTGASATFDDDDRSRLDIDVLAPDQALTVGVKTVRCLFESSSPPNTDRFSITVLSATDDTGESVASEEVSVAILITKWDPNYDDGVGGDSTAPQYDIVVSVSSATALGALQLEIVHLGNAGSWVGRGAGVDCVSMVDAILAANFVGGRGVKVGLISLQGIPTPGPVVRCGFRTRESLHPASFQIRLVDAADTDSEPVDPLPDLVISSIVQR